MVTFAHFSNLKSNMSIAHMIDSEVAKDAIVESMSGLKAKDIVVVDLRGIDAAVTDFFVICHADSSTHMNGIINAISRDVLESIQQKPWHQEGNQNSEWVLLDYVDVVAHVFQRDARDFYNIEELWADAPTYKIEE